MTDKIGEIVQTSTGLFREGMKKVDTVTGEVVKFGQGGIIDTSKGMFDNLNIGNNVSDIVQKTENMVGGLKDQIMAPVSTTSKALSEGAALLKASDTKVMNAVSSFSSSVYKNINNLVGALSGGALNSSDLKRYVNFQDGKPVLNKRAFMSTLRRELGFDVENIDGFSDRLVNQMYSKWNKATGGFLGNITDKNGSKISFVSDYGEMFGFNSISFLSSYDRDWREVTNNNMVNTFYDVTFEYVTKAGMTEGYDAVFDKYANKDDAKIALLNCIGYILYNGDIDGLVKACQLLRGVGSPDVFEATGPATGLEGLSILATSYPNLPQTFLSRFRIRPSMRMRSRTILKDKIIGILTILFGDNWYKCKVLGKDGLDAIDLKRVYNISQDSVNVLSLVDELMPLLVCRGSVKQVSAVTQFRKDFPAVPML